MYLWYSSLLRDKKTKEEKAKVISEFHNSIREYMNPLLKEISAKDKYLDIAVVRFVLLMCYDMDVFDFPKSREGKRKGEGVSSQVL